MTPPSSACGPGLSRTVVNRDSGPPLPARRNLDGVSLAPPSTLALGDRFARELPEMALPWRADDAPDPRLLVLNESLAAELGLDPAALRSPEGVRLLLGTAVPGGATPVAQAYAGHQFGGFVPASRRRSCAAAR